MQNSIIVNSSLANLIFIHPYQMIRNDVLGYIYILLLLASYGTFRGVFRANGASVYYHCTTLKSMSIVLLFFIHCHGCSTNHSKSSLLREVDESIFKKVKDAKLH